jgi:hypothetical protein
MIVDSSANKLDYKNIRSEYLKKSIEASIKQIKENAVFANDKNFLEQINNLENNLNPDYVQKLIALVDSIRTNAPEQKSFFKKPKNIPEEIKGEINEDLNELERCFNSNCYRSCVILCGRMLETALFRKYYDATGKDLLEKAPGTGLGKLISLLRENNINLDPALTQQIHLVNQIRVFSVHAKKEVFIPSPEQTQAIILYSMDILNKLF